MELLFDKDSDGSREISELLGYMDADMKYDRLKPDVRTATNELIRLIGQPMYDAILAAYQSDSPELSDLVYAARYPIAVRAYALFAPSNDLAHTNNGRKMRKDDKEVAPFEHMIVRDNEAQERRYYRALDDLLTALEANTTWKNSEAYQKVNRLFIRTTDEFDEYFRIESRLILYKLEPGIRKCEEDEIIPRIGQAKYGQLKAFITGTEPIPAEDKKLINLIREASVYYSLAWAMTRLSVTIFPEGVLQAYTSDRDTIKIKQPAKSTEPQLAQQAFKDDAENILLKIEQHVAPPPAPADTETPLLPEAYKGRNFISF